MFAKPPYSALAVANWFIENLPETTPLKLQKLIYFAHGWHLALKGKPLIDDVVQAWDYGPVVQSVYHEFKQFGKSPIPSFAFATTVDLDNEGDLRIVTPRIPRDDGDTQKFLIRVAEVLGKFSGLQLSASTHKEGTPWADTVQSNPGRKYVVIPDERIKAYFEKASSRPNA
jgi:uncharacterized phage-associated protein